MRRRSIIVLVCLLAAGCAAAAPEETPEWQGRLPTRMPTSTPTVTPFAISAEAYHELGIERQRRGDREAARRYFDWALERDPGFATAYVSRGSLKLAEGDLDGALEDAEAALEIAPLARAYALRGEVLRRRGRAAEALRAYERAVAMEPTLWDAVFPSRWETAREEEAQEELERLAAGYAERRPHDALRFYYQGWAALEADRDAEAVELFSQGLETSEKQTALFWYLLGRTYTRMGAWGEAIVSLETARAMLEQNDTSMALHTEQSVAELFAALGRAYLGVYRCGDAETMLSYAVSVGASEEELGRELERARICPTATPVSFATATPSG